MSLSFTRVLTALVIGGVLLFGTACTSANPPADTPTPLILTQFPTITSPPPIGLITLPPEYTRTPTFTPTSPPTATPTPTITPTLSAQDACAELEFPAESFDGRTFNTASQNVVIVGAPVAGVRMTWVLTNLTTDERDELTFGEGEMALVGPATLVLPGVWRWEVILTRIPTPDSDDPPETLCTREVSFTLVRLTTPTPPAPSLLEEILEVIGRRLLPSHTPTASPAP